MKALIIDDEPHVITVARLLVPWDKLGIDTVLSSGSCEEALQIISQEKPDIILSDINLPGLSGLDLIERLNAENSPAQVILITAYSDFSYAQRAVKLGCVDYLLKPLNEKALTDAVNKAISRCQKSRKLQINTDHARVMDLVTRIMNLAGGKTDWDEESGEVSSSAANIEEDLKELLEMFPKQAQSSFFRIGMICIHHLPSGTRARFNFFDRVQTILDRHSDGAAGSWGGNRDLTLLLPDHGVMTETLCQNLLQEIQTETGVCLQMGLSQPVSRAAFIHIREPEFRSSIEYACRNAWEYTICANRTENIPLVHTSSQRIAPLPNLDWMNRIIYSVLTSGQSQQISALAEKITVLLTGEGFFTVDQMEHFLSLYNSSRTRCVRCLLQEQGLPYAVPVLFTGNFFTSHGIFSRDLCCQRLIEDLTSMMEQYIPKTEALGTAAICQKIRHYLETHYAEDISLDNLAQRFALSPAYLSRSYKKEMSIGLIDDLTRIRLEEACRLMDTNQKTADIALAVGFTDPKYFSRVFKKMKGMSPSAYRNGKD
ncbi:MAG: response regulator [Clostridiales bacterium]|nr:response regulator [Clostridiales bacterium]